VTGYSGYGAEQGQGPLREALAQTFYPVRGGEGGAVQRWLTDALCARA
jgi:hypothetical protein